MIQLLFSYVASVRRAKQKGKNNDNNIITTRGISSPRYCCNVGYLDAAPSKKSRFKARVTICNHKHRTPLCCVLRTHSKECSLAPTSNLPTKRSNLTKFPIYTLHLRLSPLISTAAKLFYTHHEARQAPLGHSVLRVHSTVLLTVTPFSSISCDMITKVYALTASGQLSPDCHLLFPQSPRRSSRGAASQIHITVSILLLLRRASKSFSNSEFSSCKLGSRSSESILLWSPMSIELKSALLATDDA